MLQDTYSIELNQENQLEIVIYEVNLIRKDNKPYYQYNEKKRILSFPESFKEDLKEVRKTCIPINRYEGSDRYQFDNPEHSTFNYTVLSLFLPMQHQSLEKAYDIVFGGAFCSIILYNTFVNVNTGEIKAIKTGKINIWSEEVEEQLRKEGYKLISESFLGNYIETINSYRNRPFTLKRKIEK